MNRHVVSGVPTRSEHVDRVRCRWRSLTRLAILWLAGIPVVGAPEIPEPYRSSIERMRVHREINADGRERFQLYNACRPMQMTAVPFWTEDAEDLGIDRWHFHNLVQSRLQAAGLWTDSEDESGGAWLEVSVVVFGLTYYMRIEYKKRVVDDASGAASMAPTWSAFSPGFFDPEGTPEQSREWIERSFSIQLDRFLTEYLWVNESDCLEDPLAARAVDPPPVAATGTGVSVPKEHIPVYYCLLAYFEMQAGHALRNGHFHQVLGQLGIPNTSHVKDRLIHLTLQLNELHDKTLDLSEYEHDPEAWDKAQDAFIERQARTTKALYDSFLEAVRKEGLDADAMHEIMVEEGRKGSGMAVYAEDGEARYSPRHRAILRLFEPDTTNPWLVEN